MDLHDGLLQSLAAIRFRLHAAKAEQGPRQAASIDCALEVIAREQQTLRAFVEDLTNQNSREDEPADWPVASIADGLDRIARAWDCRLDLRFAPAHFVLPQQYAEQIGMLLREAVSNAVRHARAKRLSIEVARRPGLIRIIFEERRPAPKAPTASRSRSLEARVAALNGSMSLYATPDARTTVFVIPTHAF